MIRTYEFYAEKFNISPSEVKRIADIISDVENGIINENDIRSLRENGLKFCICEGKYDVFKKLVSPFEFQENGKVCYKYLLDAISLGIVEFIQECPSSMMEHWAIVNANLSYNASIFDEEFIPVPVEETSKKAVILYPSIKKELLDAIYNIDLAKVMNIKIKDVLARQINGTGFPIRSERDIVYYAELPFLFPCIDLFRKNIITLSNDTSGCYDDPGTDESEVLRSNILIDYTSLDDYNKAVAKELIESGNAVMYEYGSNVSLSLEVPNRINETVHQVSKRMINLLSKFHKQDMIYGKLSFDALCDLMEGWYNYLGENEKRSVYAILEKGYTDENIIEALKYFKFITVYYDKDQQTFWRSEYYYKKHREYLEEQPDFGSQGLK